MDSNLTTSTTTTTTTTSKSDTILASIGGQSVVTPLVGTNHPPAAAAVLPVRLQVLPTCSSKPIQVLSGNPSVPAPKVQIIPGSQIVLIPSPANPGSEGSTNNSAAAVAAAAAASSTTVTKVALIKTSGRVLPSENMEVRVDPPTGIPGAVRIGRLVTTPKAEDSNSKDKKAIVIAPSSPGGTTILLKDGNFGNSLRSAAVGDRKSEETQHQRLDEANRMLLPETKAEKKDSASQVTSVQKESFKSNDDSEENDESEDEALMKPLEEEEDDDAEEVDDDGTKEIKGLRCAQNEFGAFELLSSTYSSSSNSSSSSSSSTCESLINKDTKKAEEDDEEMDLTCKEEAPTSPASSVVSDGKDGGPKIRDDEILCCEGCGCYGMAGEFFNTVSCSSLCQGRIAQRKREKEKRERELMAQKLKREARRKEIREAKEKEKAKLLSEEQEEAKLKAEIENKVKSEAEQQRQQQQREISSPPPPLSSPSSRMKNASYSGFNSSYPWYDAKKGAFCWAKYLEVTGAKGTPLRLFKNNTYTPPPSNWFKVGMKLEAIDPEHPYLLCVVSIAEIQGYRLRLHFDSYSHSYDFWENGDSLNIFPPGWAASHGQEDKFSPPKGYTREDFNWTRYLQDTKSIGASERLFRPKSRVSELHEWKVGMKLEAVDKQNTAMVCVASVANVMDGRILVHFDGWESDYDYWVTPNSPYIHHKGWCKENKFHLNPPNGYPSDVVFEWDNYLSETGSKAVPVWAFKCRNSVSGFKRDMKLEVVDKRNPVLIRVANIQQVRGRQLKIHFDGWAEEYDYWVDDESPDIHPPTWCEKTGGHPLMPPLTPEEVKYFAERAGCPTAGCRGIGHIRGAKFTSHHTLAACPYSPQNMNQENHLPDRIQERMIQKEELWPKAPNEKPNSSSKRVISSNDEENIEEGGLGRGNRKRKRRKFFDEDKEEQQRQRRQERMAKEQKQKQPEDENGDDDADEEEVEDGERRSRIIIDEGAIRESVFRPPGYFPLPPRSSSSSPSPSLSDHHQRFPLAWERNSSFLLEKISGLPDVSTWSVSDVVRFVKTLPGLDRRLAEQFSEEEVDGESFALLTQEDLVKILGLKLGPALKIFHAVQLLKAHSVGSTNNKRL